MLVRPKVHPTRLHKIRKEQLFDFLEEMLVLQQSSSELLGLASEQSRDPELKKHLSELVLELDRQNDQVMTAMRDLGGNPAHLGLAAKLQKERGEALLHLHPPRSLRELAEIETAWHATIREDVQLTFLFSIGPFLESVHAQDVIAALVEELQEGLRSREEWLEQTFHRLLLQRALGATAEHHRRAA